VRAFFASTRELRLCRDIVNGSKHLMVKHASVDPAHRIHSEYVPPPLDGSASASASYDLVVAWGGNGGTIRLLELCSRCVDQVGGFLTAHRLLP
jgi:hypothetical protein